MVALTLLLCTQSLWAQVQVNIVLVPPYPIHVDDYLKMGDFAALTLINQGATPQSIKLIPSIKSDDGKWARVKPTFKPSKPIELAAFQTRTITAFELKAINANLSADFIEQKGFDKNQIARTEALPEGTYEVCIEARNYNTDAVLSNTEGCANINLTYYDPPVLTQPAEGQDIFSPGQQLLTFNWIPTGMAGKTQYQLQLIDMTKNNLFNPNDAFLNPAIQTLFDKKNLVTNTFVYGLSEPQLVAGHRYAVRVRAYDPQNKTLYKNEGVGPVSFFTYAGSIANVGVGTGLPKPTTTEIQLRVGAKKGYRHKVKDKLETTTLGEISALAALRVIGENGETCTEIRIRKKGTTVYSRLLPQDDGTYASQVEDSTYFMLVSKGLMGEGFVEIVLTFLDKNGKVLNEEEHQLKPNYGGEVYLVTIKTEEGTTSGYAVALPKVTEKEIKEFFKEMCGDNLQSVKKHEGAFSSDEQITCLWDAGECCDDDKPVQALVFPGLRQSGGGKKPKIHYARYIGPKTKIARRWSEP